MRSRATRTLDKQHCARQFRASKLMGNLKATFSIYFFKERRRKENKQAGLVVQTARSINSSCRCIVSFRQFVFRDGRPRLAPGAADTKSRETNKYSGANPFAICRATRSSSADVGRNGDGLPGPSVAPIRSVVYRDRRAGVHRTLIALLLPITDGTEAAGASTAQRERCLGLCD